MNKPQGDFTIMPRAIITLELLAGQDPQSGEMDAYERVLHDAMIGWRREPEPKPAGAACLRCRGSRYNSSPTLKRLPQYRQLVRSAPGGAVLAMRSMICGTYIWL